MPKITRPSELKEQTRLLELMKQAYIPGMSVATVVNGELSTRMSLGISNVENGELVADSTVFEAASLSKPVFAYLVLKLIKSGKFNFNLDMPLHKILPHERLGHDTRTTTLTARMVLSHQTGLPNWQRGRLDLQFDPGTGFHYSGEGYVYLQKVVEKMTGMKLEELAKEHVFGPLGMEHSHYSWSEEKDAEMQLAVGHNEAGQPQTKFKPRKENSAASLHTTASDYAKFLVAWLKGDAILQKAIEEIESSVCMTSDKQIAKKQDLSEGGLKKLFWGLGWGLQETDQGTTAFHWGDNGIFKAFVAMNLQDRSAIVYFANSVNGLAIAQEVVTPIVGDVSLFCDWLFDKYGYEHYDVPGWKEWHDGRAEETLGNYEEAIRRFEAASKLKPNDEVIEHRIEWLNELLLLRPGTGVVVIPKEILQQYVGQYGSQLITIENDRLKVEVDGQIFRLIPLSENNFLLDSDVRLIRLQFIMGEEGSPIKLKTHFFKGEAMESLRDEAEIQSKKSRGISLIK